MADNGHPKEEGETMYVEAVSNALSGTVDESAKFETEEGPVLVPQPTHDPNDPLASYHSEPHHRQDIYQCNPPSLETERNLLSSKC